MANMRVRAAGLLGLAAAGGIARFGQEFFARAAELDRWQQERHQWQGLPNDIAIAAASATVDEVETPQRPLGKPSPALLAFGGSAALYL